MTWRPRIFLMAGLALWLGAGCATVPLDRALGNFNRGNLDAADKDLASIPDGPDAVRHLMDRGMIHHLRHDYTASTADWARAIKLEEALDTHSISKAGTSMLINDSTLAFRGHPYERTYLHVFQARNYLAQGLWDDAAVEARNIIYRQEHLNGFPDDAYSRYLAGLCLAVSGDDSGAAFQYRLADALLPELSINPSTGTFGPDAQTNATPTPDPGQYELVCLVDIDSGGNLATPDIYAGGKFLGSARVLTDTMTLAATSQEKMAARKMAKSVARIALKEGIAAVVAAHNEDLGDMVRVLLFSMEVPDERAWETLPHLLAVARVPCPPDLQTFDVVFRNHYGRGPGRITVSGPLVRRDRTFFAFCRDFP
jgi:hypothetical protein